MNPHWIYLILAVIVFLGIVDIIVKKDGDDDDFYCP